MAGFRVPSPLSPSKLKGVTRVASRRILGHLSKVKAVYTVAVIVLIPLSLSMLKPKNKITLNKNEIAGFQVSEPALETKATEARLTGNRYY